MEYIFEKSMLTELANGGCQKQVINRLDKEWQKTWKRNKEEGNELPNKDYIREKLMHIPSPDTPPLAQIKREGELAEILKLEELSNYYIIGTEVGNKDNYQEYKKFINDDGTIEFNQSNREQLKIAIEHDEINSNDFKVDLSLIDEDGLIEKFENIFNPIKYNFIYQPQFTVNDIFFEPLLIDKTEILRLIEGKKITYKSLRPDLIRIYPSSHECYVLDDKFNTIKSSNNKIKLKVCDIKMSDFSNKYFLELGLYMAALNGFIFKYGLNEKYEVMSNGSIFPQNNNLTPSEREEKILSMDTEEWECEFATVKSRLETLFNDSLIEIIRIVEERDLQKYNTVYINSKCQTCDYYGGQFSNHLKGYLKGILGRNAENSDVQKYLEDPNNNFCRYKLQQTEDINVLSCLKTGEKTQLINSSVNIIEELDDELNDESSEIFNSNKTLKANKQIITENVYVRKEGIPFKSTGNRTLNAPRFSNLTIFMDERHDTQGRTLSFSFSFTFIGIDPNGNEVSENNLKEPYISIIDDYNPINEKRAFLDYLIKINELLEKYEKYTNKYGGNATFSVLYWSEEATTHFETLFLNVLKYLTSFGENIEEIYQGLTQQIINDKKRDVKKLLYRFNTFFTSDDQLQDYRIVEKNPFFSLKKATGDLFVFNIDFNNTLLRVRNSFFEWKMKEIFYKPDSDQFNGAIFTQVWRSWEDNAVKSQFLNEKLKPVLKNRLDALSNVFSVLGKEYRSNLKGVSPEIPIPSRINLFPELKFGTELVLFQRLNTVFSKLEKESIHNQEAYSKTVLGKSVLLTNEVIGEERVNILSSYNKSHLDDSNYRVYRMSEDAIDSKIDNKSIFLTIYPEDKTDYIFKKFTTDINYKDFSIYYNQEEQLKNVRLFKGKGQGIKMYLEALNVNIEEFDRFNKIIIISFTNESLTIMEHMQEHYNFDYSNNLILEEIHVDIWEKRLKSALQRLEKNPTAIKIIEDFEHETVNSFSEKEIEEVLIQKYDVVPLDHSQISAITTILNNRLTLLWGPPGTGKSHTIANLLLFKYLSQPEQFKILLLGNYDATDNIMDSTRKLLDYEDVSFVRVKSLGRANGNFEEMNNSYFREFEIGEDSKEIVKLEYKFQLFSCTPQQVEKVFVNNSARKFKFDLIIVDEASQMDVGHFIPGLIKAGPDTQYLFAGDDLQLPPVLQVRMEEAKENFYSSIYDYYNLEYGPAYPAIKKELLYNRRSNYPIVEFSKIAFGYPPNYKAADENKRGEINFEELLNKENFYDKVLDPSEPIVMLTYKDGVAHQSNEFEALEVVQIVKNAWEKGLKNIKGKRYDILEFFDKGIGIIVPHRAQRTLIQSKLHDYFIKDNQHNFDEETMEILPSKVTSSVDTVEKYQGQQRDIMICSYVLGDPDLIAQEEEFIFNPNRLNVIISRARFKMIVLASDELLTYSSDNLKVVDNQRSLHQLMEYCEVRNVINNEKWVNKNGKFRVRTF